MDRRLFYWVFMSVMALCALPAFAAPKYADIVARVTSQHVAPAYSRLDKSSKALATTLDAACAEQSHPIDMQPVRLAFHYAMNDWQYIQHIRSGPVSINSRHTRLEFWPDKRGIGGRHLTRLLTTGTEKDVAANALAAGSVALQGFPALERLLFDDTLLSNTPATDETIPRCAVAVSVAHNIASIASSLADNVSTVDAFGADAKTTTKAMLRDLITAFEFVQRLKIEAPLGKDRPRVRLAENWRSQRSLQNVSINMRGLRELFAALYGPKDKTDPEGLLVFDQFDAAIRSADQFDNDYKAVLEGENGRIRLKAFAGTLEDLKKLIAIGMTEHLDVNLGFNSLDGD